MRVRAEARTRFDHAVPDHYDQVLEGLEVPI